MDKKGKIIGITVFFLGIALLLFVFGLAFVMFTPSFSKLIQLNEISASKLGNAIIELILKITLLFIMTIAGSIISGKGIQLYLGASEIKRKGED